PAAAGDKLTIGTDGHGVNPIGMTGQRFERGAGRGIPELHSGIGAASREYRVFHVGMMSHAKYRLGVREVSNLLADLFAGIGRLPLTDLTVVAGGEAGLAVAGNADGIDRILVIGEGQHRLLGI